ncbi:alpha-galactosidase [Vibrio sp. 10N.261.55.A7]|uniref:alpha-galactosidase n=1 Tax=Vibrio sp. 10N.261.55.A7 TaxID=1880851 RepID=UPI000C843C4B|nr:alpha-galactosidase [Vibrio sp. 10N.261.55.A7]PMJ92595.1 alpha-galactosidase [Vibrio sp. 10N.261.55.A7]
MTPFIQLHSQPVSVVIKLTPAPEIIYWGKAIAPLNNERFDALLISQVRAVPQARLDHDVPLTLCPDLGRGSFGSSGIEGHHDGLNSMPRFSYVSHSVELDSLDSRTEIRCEDTQAQLRLTISLTLNASSGVLRKKLTIENQAKANYCLNKLVLTLPVPQRATELESYHGRWSREFQAQRQRLTHNAWQVENRRGRTSHEYFPGCLVGQQGFKEQTGEIWAFHLGWSGNHQLRADVKSDGRRFVQAGELLLPGEVILGQGERYSTPELFASYSAKGINGIRRHSHQFVRENIIPFERNKPRPVHLNTWEGIYFDHDPDYISEMAIEAASIGVERFIIDDGWFKGRNDDKTSLGDWTLDTDKYPNGLTPVIEQVNRLGMSFGIWVEPEMVNEESELFRSHPDWMLRTNGYTQPTGRYQYVLNLQITECFDYLYQCLDTLLTENNIEYVKWDMNRELVQPTHNGKASVHGQTLALYRLLDKLVNAHPNVEIESCSSGGGRIDYEVLKRTCRFWTSDCNDALERQTIQKHMGIFFPPEVMGAHIGPYHSHTTRRTHDINLRGLTALTGHMGVELDPVKESDAEKQAFAKYITLHKQYRDLLHDGESFYLDNIDGRRFSYGVTKDDKQLLVVCQTAMPDYALPEPLRLIDLEADKTYQVKLIDYPQSSHQLMKESQGWWESREVEASGEWLMNVGLSLPILDPESALLLEIRGVTK